MLNKKSFFGLFGSSDDKKVSEEEKKQREYALSKAKEEKSGNADDNKSAESSKSQPKTQTQTKDRPKSERHNREQEPREEVPAEIAEFVVEKLDNIINDSQLEAEVKLEKNEDGVVHIEVISEKDSGCIIGKDGNGLEAYQILLRGFVYKQYDRYIKIVIDIDNYRQRREGALKEKALKAAKNVIERNKKSELSPMNATERRAIHQLFQDDENIRTYSVGQGNNRRIVLAKKGNGGNGNGQSDQENA